MLSAISEKVVEGRMRKMVVDLALRLHPVKEVPDNYIVLGAD